MNADGSGQRRLTRLAGYNSVLAWLPDGKIAFVSSHGPNDFEIYVMNADGSGQRNLTREWGLDGFPVWSPDGQKIAFTSKRDGNWEVYVMNADGSGQRRLTRNAAVEWPLLPGRPTGGRSPSDATARRRQRRDLRHQRRRQRAAEADAKRAATRWSPDGRKIAFTSKRNGNAEIYVMNADGSGQRNLTRSPARVNDSPVWSPAQKKQ